MQQKRVGGGATQGVELLPSKHGSKCQLFQKIKKPASCEVKKGRGSIFCCTMRYKTSLKGSGRSKVSRSLKNVKK
jgi:hypothetical protein